MLSRTFPLRQKFKIGTVSSVRCTNWSSRSVSVYFIVCDLVYRSCQAPPSTRRNPKVWIFFSLLFFFLIKARHKPPQKHTPKEIQKIAIQTLNFEKFANASDKLAVFVEIRSLEVRKKKICNKRKWRKKREGKKK